MSLPRAQRRRSRVDSPRFGLGLPGATNDAFSVFLLRVPHLCSVGHGRSQPSLGRPRRARVCALQPRGRAHCLEPGSRRGSIGRCSGLGAPRTLAACRRVGRGRGKGRVAAGRDDSKCSRFAVASVHDSSPNGPNGAPRWTERRSAATSASDSG